jgi:hypothetical protein
MKPVCHFLFVSSRESPPSVLIFLGGMCTCRDDGLG